MALGIWWLAILWTYTVIVPRPFDDWKNGLLYVGAGVLVLAIAMKRKIAGPVTVVCTSPEKAARTQTTAPPAIFLFIVISYFLLCTISIAVAPTGKYEGLLELARMILWAGLAWAFAQCSARTWIWLMRVTVMSAAIIAILTWQTDWMRFIFQLFPWRIPIYPFPFLAPVGHITYYGDFMALGLVMAVGLLFQKSARHATGPVLWLTCMFLIDIGLALSATRASLVGVIAAVLLAIPLVGYASRSSKAVAVIVLIGLLNLAVIFSLPIKSVRGGTASMRLQQTTNISKATMDAVSSGRWHTYITSAHIAMERPLLGWGLGTFRFVYPEFAHRNDHDLAVSSSLWYMHPHNEILHQAVELGFPGAILFFLGFAYLLYGGIRALRRSSQRGVGFTPGSLLINERPCGDDNILLITAMCGLVAAFVSWQFSTNFLFPVSRLVTALFAGIIMSFVPHALPLRGRMAPHLMRGQERGKYTWAIITIVSLSTLLLFANQVSLICVQKQQTATTIDNAQNAATWAVRLAPGAFDPLFIRASVAMRTEPPLLAAPAVESFYASYPYVPVAIHMMGVLRYRQGKIPETRELLQHAVANDPSNSNAKQLLDQLPPEH